MAKKYKVMQNGVFLGHHSGHTPQDAVRKAVQKYGEYYNMDTAGQFTVTGNGLFNQEVYL